MLPQTMAWRAGSEVDARECQGVPSTVWDFTSARGPQSWPGSNTGDRFSRMACPWVLRRAGSFAASWQSWREGGVFEHKLFNADCLLHAKLPANWPPIGE